MFQFLLAFFFTFNSLIAKSFKIGVLTYKETVISGFFSFKKIQNKQEVLLELVLREFLLKKVFFNILLF